MGKRALILLLLMGLLAILTPEQSVSAQCNCDGPFGQCMQQAVYENESCQHNAYGVYLGCMDWIGIESYCWQWYYDFEYTCEINFSNAENACDSSYSTCLAGCGGGGGGGGTGGICHDDQQMGYQTQSVEYFSSYLSACVADGGSAFTDAGLSRDYFDLCMTNTNGQNQEICCREQIKNLLDTYGSCHLGGPGNSSSCRHCVTF